MNRQRMTALLVGHTLAEGRPLGPLLRDLGEPGAASNAEAGDLDSSLCYINISADLRRLATLCPGALQPAQARISALPSPLIFQLPLLQALGYLVLVGSLQGLCILMLIFKVLPSINDLTASSPSMGIIHFTPLALGALLVLLPLGARLLARQRPWSWRQHYTRARQAAMAAGLAAAGASAETRREFSTQLTELSQAGACVAELDLVVARSLALAEQAHQRLVSTVKLLGTAGLISIALLIMVHIYSLLTSISVNL